MILRWSFRIGRLVTQCLFMLQVSWSFGAVSVFMSPTWICLHQNTAGLKLLTLGLAQAEQVSNLSFLLGSKFLDGCFSRFFNCFLDSPYSRMLSKRSSLFWFNSSLTSLFSGSELAFGLQHTSQLHIIFYKLTGHGVLVGWYLIYIIV